MLLYPGHNPLRRVFFGQCARAGIVHQHVAGAPGPEFGEQLIEALSALAESVLVRCVSECNQTVGDVAEIWFLRFQAADQFLRVVGHVAISVGRGANQERAAALKNTGVKVIHHLDLGLVARRLQRLLDLMSDHVGSSGHGANQDRDVYRHAQRPTKPIRSTPGLLNSAYYTCRPGSIMHPPWAVSATYCMWRMASPRCP